MLSAKAIVRNRTPLLASSAAAAASIAFVAFGSRRKEENAVNTTSGRDRAENGLLNRKDDAPLFFIRPFGASFVPHNFNNNVGILSDAMFPPPSSKYCSCESTIQSVPTRGPRRHQTMVWLDKTSSKATLESRYKINWKHTLGEGGFGAVYMCTDRKTGEKHALKMIPKEYTDEDSFEREMNALLRVRDSGSHPNICKLKENFDQKGNYYLVMDLISGGEMFDQLAENGAYSEADAARLVKETASALAFLHGVGMVHADLKPENLMLSTKNKSDSVIKLVDFGCTEPYKGVLDIDSKQVRMHTYTTPAYSPPEAFAKHKGPLSPSFDMWGMGCIIYIMLTGAHPFDLDGQSTDEEMEERIKSGEIPLRGSPYTEHLSNSAIDLIEKLMTSRPRRRMTAMQMLDHPWVKGETAKTDTIEGSDKKLGSLRKFKSRLEAKVFSDWISGATDDAAKKTSLIERAFVSATDLSKHLTDKGEKGGKDDGDLSISGLSDMLSDNMVNKYFPEGHVVFKEGAKDDFVYFLNSGTVEVSTKSGFKTTLSQGQMFGEGALLENKGQTKGRRSASIKCLTPVHAIRISKEYFEKYRKAGGSDINLTLREQDRARDRDRALKILSLQKNLFERNLSEGDVLFSCGEDGKSMFIVDEGEIEIIGETGKFILNVGEGEMCGEQALVTGLPRNVTAVCATQECKVYELQAKDFFKVFNSSPSMKQSFQEICFRRDFQKAIAKKFGKDFSTSLGELRKAFDAMDLDQSGSIDLEEVTDLLRSIYPTLPIDHPLFTQALQTLDIDGDNLVTWDEFKKVFS